jgi:ABC-type proline/glycine betaine transport system ATPase subunit
MLDEPFAGVDAETRSALLEDSLLAIRSTARATLVVVHDRSEAWALADRLLILLDGRLVASGVPDDLLERPPTAAVARFLGFDGMLEDGERMLLTRPPHVVIDADGPLEARVGRAIPQEDWVRLALVLDGGTVYAVAARPAPVVGDVVRLRLVGGASFPFDGR